ncbi:DNA topoisomerase, partial [Klebsiella pneumoniae]
NKRIFDNTKISDHFAIVPTGVISDQLSDDEKRIYELVARRFIAAFFPSAQFVNTVRTTLVAGQTFISKGRVLQSAGWLEVLDELGDDG